MRPHLASLLITAALGSSAVHADGIDLTLYHHDDNSLFNAGDGASVDAGYAVVHEPRQLSLAQGSQEVRLDDLPAYLDGESLSLNILGGGARVLSQRLSLGQGQRATLSQWIGQRVTVSGSAGQTIVAGTLLGAGDGLLVRDEAHPGGSSVLVRDYAAVSAAGQLALGPSLDLRIDASRAGKFAAELSYPTTGLGWRAAYVATLQPGNRCRVQLESRASIANRSGRDWKQVRLKLVAGQPRIEGGGGAPRPMLMARVQAAGAPPSQASMGDYRSFTLPAPVDLPDGSISQAPLYATRTIDCERVALIQEGSPGNFSPPKPDTGDDGGNQQQLAVNSTLSFKAFDNLPAGKLRVLQVDRDGHAEFVGEGQLSDTPKDRPAKLVLGQVFDLQGTRERTAFKYDKAGRSLDEAFRINVTNSGDDARTVTLREYPDRWREWTLVSANVQPSQRKTDMLEFKLQVPAHGQASLKYALRYHWSAQDD